MDNIKSLIVAVGRYVGSGGAGGAAGAWLWHAAISARQKTSIERPIEIRKVRIRALLRSTPQLNLNRIVLFTLIG